MRATAGASGRTAGSSRSAAQHELNQGLSVNGGVFWRWFGNFLVTDNTSGTVRRLRAVLRHAGLIPAAPASAGGESLPSDINTDRLLQHQPRRAVQQRHRAVEDDVPRQQRLRPLVRLRHDGATSGCRSGIIFQGGLSTGHQTTDFCDVQDPAKAGNNALVEMLASGQLPSLANTCHMEQNWLPQVKFLGSYTIPKIDVQLGASFQSIPGIEYAAQLRRAQQRPVAAGGAGRPRPSAGGGVATGTTTVNLIQPGSFYGPRFNQIDVRLGKVMRFGSRRAVASLDLFNILNSDTISSASAAYATWLAPQAVVAPRLMKVSLTFDF